MLAACSTSWTSSPARAWRSGFSRSLSSPTSSMYWPPCSSCADFRSTSAPTTARSSSPRPCDSQGSFRASVHLGAPARGGAGNTARRWISTGARAAGPHPRRQARLAGMRAGGPRSKGRSREVVDLTALTVADQASPSVVRAATGQAVIRGVCGRVSRRGASSSPCRSPAGVPRWRCAAPLPAHRLPSRTGRGGSRW